MAKLYITEYGQMARVANNRDVMTGQEPCVVDQTPVVIGAGSLQSAAFNANTKFVMIHTDAICSIAFGADPTATANKQRLAANETRFYGVIPGQKVAVITNT